MQTAPKILIALLLAAMFTACSADNPNNSANQTEIPANSNKAHSLKDGIDELEMTIKLPFRPEEALWHVEPLGKSGNERVPGPTDKKLAAVLRFSKEDAEKIVALAEKHRPVLNETINTENWFPAELIAQSQTSGDETLKGKSYAANDFLNAPYTDGKIIRIDGTDYFVLELFAK